MRNSRLIAVAVATAALSAALLIAQVTAIAQAPAPASADDKAKAARASRIAERFERDARILTIFDRQGKVVTTVGERALYNQVAFSSDGTRLVVNKFDLESETQDLWLLDVATGKNTRITASQTREPARTGVWSPDGSQVAYTALRGGSEGLYRRTSNGDRVEELLYRHPGAALILRDWSMNGRFLSFSTTDLSGGILYALPLAGDGERSPIEVFRSESQVLDPRLSPNSRFVSYVSDQSGKPEVYVRPFDPAAGPRAVPAAGPWQVSDQGVSSSAYWRRDGKEMYYFGADRGLMVVEVDTAPTFTFGKPKLLFRLSEAVPVPSNLVNVTAGRP